MTTAIPKLMRAVVYHGANDLRVETLPVPHIGSNEMLVKVAVCGVCPTDIKKIHYGTVPPPRIFGHETAGTIVRLGARVRGFRIGERVALHHHVPCLKCHACRHRAFAQCPQYKRTGITAGFEPAGGGYAEYARVLPFVMPGVVKIPPRNSFLEGAMLEPVNTVLKAVKRLALLRGDIVLVAGQGPIGLIFTRLLRLVGMRVLATDLLVPRLELAREFGAKWAASPKSKVHPSSVAASWPPKRNSTEGRLRRVESPPVLRSSTLASEAEFCGGPAAEGGKSKVRLRTAQHVPMLSEFVNRITNGRGLDAAVVAVPSDEVVRQAQEMVRGGGQVLVFSHTRRGAETALDLAEICVDEKDLIGSYSADFTLQREVARLVFGRRLDVRRLITHKFPLEQTAEAIELAASPTDDSLKVVMSQMTKDL